MELIDGQTPLDPDEEQGLIPSLTMRAELNEFEQSNIATALLWAQKSRILKKQLIAVDSLKLLHRHMFDKTWRWAGRFRQTAKNIGVEPHQVADQLIQLGGNAQYWLDNNVYPLDECAVRLHHKLVFIHPFPNGNGRHARLTADLLMYFNGQPMLTWGGASLDVEGETRQQYLVALREADRGQFTNLLAFATKK